MLQSGWRESGIYFKNLFEHDCNAKIKTAANDLEMLIRRRFYGFKTVLSDLEKPESVACSQTASGFRGEVFDIRQMVAIQLVG